MNVLVVTPTYNERDNLPDLVRAILTYPETRVMVVDDQSPDGTGAIADALATEYPGRVMVVHRTGKRGLGRSYVEGLQIAIKERRRPDLPDGRRLVARSEVPARDGARPRRTTTWSSARGTFAACRW